jgi:hypothetical protein
MDYDSDEELQQLIRARAEKEKKGEYSQIHTCTLVSLSHPLEALSSRSITQHMDFREQQ